MAASAGITVTFNSVALGKLVDISHSGMQVGTVESTAQDTTPDSNSQIWRTHESSGFVEPGEYTLKLRFDGTLPALGTKASLVVHWTPLSKTWTWANAIYIGFDPTGAMGTELDVSVKFKLSGSPTVT